MKLKLTYIQFMALLELHKHFATVNHPEAMHEKLAHVLLLLIYQKLYAKAIEKKKKYSISLTVPEALTFWLYWHDHKYHPASFEGNLLNTINNSIHQKFSA